MLKWWRSRINQHRSRSGRFILFTGAAAQTRFRIFAIQFGDELALISSRTDRFALVSVGAVAETFGIHRLHHADHTLRSFRFALRQKREV